MICIVLAAGYATRLYPITENFPKPLLKVKDKTILDHLIDDIDSTEEISQYVIISNDRYYNHFVEWKNKKTNIKSPIIVLNDGSTSNETRLGAVIDIKFAIDNLNINDDIMVIAGDNVLDFSFKNFIDYFKEKNSTVAMRYYELSVDRLKKCGVISIDKNDKILEMTEKSPTPISNFCVPPFYIYHKKDFSLVEKGINDGCGIDAPGSMIAYMSSKTNVYAYEMPGKRYDIGNLQSYKEVQNIYKGIIK